MSAPVRLGIDVLAENGFTQLAGLRVGLLTNAACRDSAGRRTVDVLANGLGPRLSALFSPEHGLGADKDGKVASGRDGKTGLPVHSLYGDNRRPRGETLAGMDAVVIDLPDAGVRFYTYATTMAYMMEAAARLRLRVFVLDRPNPIAAAGIRGPTLDADLRSFTAYFPMPVQHAMTMGELARLFNGENGIGADLAVLAMPGYRRDMWFDQTGLPWVNPSPNLRSLQAAILYPGVALIEFTDVSVGRGASPFEVIGAPWIDGPALARYLQPRAIPGIAIRPTEFTPGADRHAGKRCQGVHIELTDRTTLDAPRLGVELASALHRLNPARFALRHVQTLLGSRRTLAAISAGDNPATIAETWGPEVQSFASRRAKYLLY